MDLVVQHLDLQVDIITIFIVIVIVIVIVKKISIFIQIKTEFNPGVYARVTNYLGWIQSNIAVGHVFLMILKL